MKLLNTPYACAFCQKSYSTGSDLVSHVQMKHITVKTKDENANDKIEIDIEKPLDGPSNIYEKEEIGTDSNQFC